MAQEPYGYPEHLQWAGTWTACWTALFYVISGTHPYWIKYCGESSKRHENERYWCTRNVIGIIHALLISILSVPAMVYYMSAPQEVLYRSSQNILSCVSPAEDEQEVYISLQLARCGLAFTTFTLSDLIVSSIHKLATWDFIFHHVAFIACGLIIRENCILPGISSALMAMEVSTPFLNVMLLLRNREDRFIFLTSICGILFFFTYTIFRIFINGYATFVVQRKAIPQLLGSGTGGVAVAPERVPAWQLWFLVVALGAGAGLQFFWYPSIFKTFVKGIGGLMSGNSGAIRDDSNKKD